MIQDLWYMLLYKQSSLLCFLRFRTPNIRRSIMGSSPCTPTPFKSALDQQEAKYGPLKLLVRKKLRNILSHLNLA